MEKVIYSRKIIMNGEQVITSFPKDYPGILLEVLRKIWNISGN